MASLSSRRGKYDRAQPTKARKAEQRAALLDAATHVFARRGFPQSSVAMVIARAGMSRRTFYEHFRDLDDVLHSIHRTYANIAFNLISSELAKVDEPLARVRTGIQLYLTAIAHNPDAARVVFREVRSAGPAYEPRHQKESQRYTDLLLGSMKEAHRKKLIPRAPDETTAYAVTTGIEAVALRYVANGQAQNVTEAEDRLVALAFRAFGVAS